MIKLDRDNVLPIKQRVQIELENHGCPTKIKQDLIYQLHDMYPRMSVLYPFKVVE